jgi:predicted PurR-regulated permease PerM
MGADLSPTPSASDGPDARHHQGPADGSHPPTEGGVEPPGTSHSHVGTAPPTPRASANPLALRRFSQVPVPSILTAIGLVLLTLGGLWVLSRITKIITWVLIAVFFAVVLRPIVDFLHRRAHLPRGIATALVLITVISTLGVMTYVFVRPIAEQTTTFIEDLPTTVTEAQEGKGTVGKLVKRYKVEDWVNRNQPRLQKEVTNLGNSAVDVARGVFNTIIASLTILVLTILFLLEGGDMFRSGLRFLPDHRRERVERVAERSAKAVTGYVAGNLLISIIAGVSTFTFLTIVGVPFAAVLALWVGFADLIPLVGATLGAIPTVAVAFLHSTTAGVATLIFYVLYQQFENHVLQVTIMSRTVALKPLSVLLSVLIGVEMFGLLGALLAIPAAGVVKVIAAEWVSWRRPDLAQPDKPPAVRLIDFRKRSKDRAPAPAPSSPR